MKAWSDVVESPEFKSLPASEQANAREQYFLEVVAPRAPREELAAVRRQFDADTRIRKTDLPQGVEPSAAGGGRGAQGGPDPDTMPLADRARRLTLADAKPIAPRQRPTPSAMPWERTSAQAAKVAGLADQPATPEPIPSTADMINAGPVEPTPRRSILEEPAPLDQRTPGLTPREVVEGSVAPWKLAQDRVQAGYGDTSRSPVARPLSPAQELTANLRDATGNPVARGAVAGVAQLGQVGVGAVRAAADAVGADGVSRFAQRASGQAETVGRGATQDLKGTDKTIAAVTSNIINSAPALAMGVAGGPAMATLFAQSAAADYAETGDIAHAGIQAAAEVLGERFGFAEQVKLLRGVVRGMPAGEVARVFGALITKEIPGEQLTTALQFLGDKAGPGARNPNATIADYLEQAGETLKVTIGQTAVMGGGPAAISSTRNALASADKTIARSGQNMAERAAQDAGFLPPVERRKATIERFDNFTAEYGLSGTAAQGIKRAAESVPLAQVPTFIKKALGKLAAAGYYRGPTDDAALQVLDEQPAAQAGAASTTPGTNVQTAIPAADLIEQDYTGLDSPEIPQGAPDAALDPVGPAAVAGAAGDPAAVPGAVAGAVPAAAVEAAQAGEAVPAGTAPTATPIDERAHAAATSPKNDRPEPTEAQKEAGNYAKGHVRINGLDIAIENPEGSVRRGIDPNGKPWETPMRAHYGYVKGSRAGDGDNSDLFIKPGTAPDYSGPVFVVDQMDPRTGKFDEHKAVVGAGSADEARDLYLSNYDASGPTRIGAITQLPFDAYRSWVRDGVKRKPIGDTSGYQPDVDRSAPVAAGASDGPGDQPGRGGRDVRSDPDADRGVVPAAEAPAPGSGTAGAVGDGAADADQALTALADRFDARGRPTDKTFATVLRGYAADIQAGKIAAADVAPQVKAYTDMLDKPAPTNAPEPAAPAEATRAEAPAPAPGAAATAADVPAARTGPLEAPGVGDALTIDGKAYTVASVGKSGKVIGLTGDDGKKRVVTTDSPAWAKAQRVAAPPPAAPKPDRRRAIAKKRMQVDPERDTLLQALAKLGGLRRDVAAREWGMKPEEQKHTVTAGGLRAFPFRATGGMGLDGAIEALTEAGYFRGVAADELANAFEAAVFDEMGGKATLTVEGQMRQAQQNADDEAQARAEAEAADDFDPFAPGGTVSTLDDFSADDIEESGYAEADAETKAMTQSLLADAEAAGLDTEALREDAARGIEGQSEDFYHARLQASIRATLQTVRQDREDAGRRDTEAARGRDADSGQAAGDQGQEGDREGLTLAAQSAADLQAKADREAAGTKAAAAKKAAEQERLRKQAEAKDLKARADATVDDFQLGQDANAQMSGMADMFAEQPVTPAPAEKPAAEQAKPEAPPMPAVVGIPREAAEAAHAGTSHVPERRAVQEQEGFLATLRNAWDRATRAAGNDPAAIERITEVFADVAEGYRSRYMAALGARSRVMSTMITGGSNFPVRRNEKRAATERKRAEEASEYLERGIKRLLRAARGPIDNSPESELERVRLNLTQREERQEFMKAANAAMRKGDDEALRDLGMSDAEIAELKKPDFAGRKGFADYELVNNNAEIRRLRERLKSAEDRMEAASAGPVETERQGVRVVEDATDDRLRLLFDGKPSEAVRNDLKAAAFKWSPKNEAWQRQLTGNARAAARQILAKHYPASESDAALSRTDTPLRRSDSAPSPTDFTIDQAREFVEKLKGMGVKANISVVQSIDDMPDTERGAVLAQQPDGRVRGAYFKTADTTWIVMDQVRDPLTFQFVLLHEAFHRGLAKTLGQDAKALLRRMYLTNPKLRKATVEQMESFGIEQDEAIEEALANMAGAGTARDLRGWDRLMVLVRAWLDKAANTLGFDIRWTDSMLQDFVAGIRNKGLTVESAGAQGGAMLSRRESDQTDTAAFRSWFGDSKVVDADGKPLVVYHGTANDISEFKAGPTFKQGHGKQMPGIYFSPLPATAAAYARTAANAKDASTEFEGANVVPAYLSISNPAEFTDPDDFARASRQRLEAAGHDGALRRNRQGEVVEIVAFRPEQIKSAIGNRGTFDPAEPSIVLSRAPNPNHTPDQREAGWTMPEGTKFDDFVYKFQDKNVDLKRAIGAITAERQALEDRWDAYLQEELFHGRAAKRTQDFVNAELQPLLRDMTLRQIKAEDLDQYLHARHAEEANKLIAERNLRPDDGQLDVDGNAITSPLQDGGSGMLTADARAYLEGLDPAVKRRLEAVSAKVDAIITSTRQMYADYGLESQETVDAWGEMFEHYVPLMREDKGGGMGIGQGFSIKGRESKSRTGSTAKVVDILANIAMQRERAIVRGEKNRVAVALAGLAKTNPAPDFWQFDKVPTERVLNETTGLVEERPVPGFKNRDNVLVAKIVDSRGKVHERAVVFNERDDRAMRMVAALKNLDAAQLEGVMGAMAKATRYFAAINTQYNPVFGVVNLVRDVQGAALNLNSTDLKDKKAAVVAGIPSALRTIYRKERGKSVKNAEMDALWEDMQSEGGMTGFRDQFRASEERATAIRFALDPTNWTESKWGKIFTAGGVLKVPMVTAQKLATPLFTWLTDYNQAMEGATRLAAYKVALEQGLSKQRAASIAKNMTVNFNRKGQVGMQAGALYAFFNASVQGTARMGEVLVDTKDGQGFALKPIGYKIIGGGILLGAMQAAMLAAMGFDDDEPPDFVRERNFIIPLGPLTGDKKYVTVPMPLGWHVFPNLGRITTEFVLSGFKDPGKRLLKLLTITAESFNPLGSTTSVAQFISPTVTDPVVALAENKDWTGRPIARQSFDRTAPGFTLARDTATTHAKVIAEAINHLSGGTKYVAGAMSPTPDQIDYLIGQVTGGVGRELGKLNQTGAAALTGEDLPPYKIPLVGRFYGDGDSTSAQGSRFYENVNRMSAHEAQIKGLTEDAGKSRDEAVKAELQRELKEYRAEHPDAALVPMANAAERRVQQLRKQKRELLAAGAPRAEVKKVEERMTAAMRMLNDAVKAKKEKAPA